MVSQAESLRPLADGFQSENLDMRVHINNIVAAHSACNHPLFALLESAPLKPRQAARLLKNYDAHASQLRRLLLKTATIMPEEAVGLILENVRNEYGNGKVEDRHQLQLQSLAWELDISRDEYKNFAVVAEVRRFIKDVTPFYYPLPPHMASAPGKYRAAIAAGAVTATEIMAVQEFKSLQIAFRQFGLADHIWFDHVQVECEHSDESLALALFFIAREDLVSVEYGLKGVLDANLHLYDGLLAALSDTED